MGDEVLTDVHAPELSVSAMLHDVLPVLITESRVSTFGFDIDALLVPDFIFTSNK